MEIPNIPPSVRAVIEIIESNPRVEEIILFGSRAVGDNSPRSDVDLAIRGSMLSEEDWMKLRVCVSEAQSLYWISLMDYDRSPPMIKLNIREQGKTIYGKKAS